jgi:RHS repeat-associated protein
MVRARGRMTSRVLRVGLGGAFSAALLAGLLPAQAFAAPDVESVRIETPDQADGSGSHDTHAVPASETAASDGRAVPAPPKPDGAVDLDTKLPRGAEPEDSPQPPAQPVPDAQPPAAQPDPEPEVEGYDKTLSRELPGERERFSQTFANPDGSRTSNFSTTPMNFKAADGTWKPIDTDLVPDAGGGWRNAADSGTVEVAETAGEDALATVELGAGRSVGFDAAGAADAPGSVEGNTVSYRGIWPATTLELQTLPGAGLKEEIVLESPVAGNRWRFPLELEGVTPRLSASGAVDLVAADGTVAGLIPAGYMEDSKRDPHSGDGAYSEAVRYALLPRAGGWDLEVTADRMWLDDPARVYPVRVDPSTVWNYGAAADTYVQTGYTTPHQNETQLKSGTWDGGDNKAATYLNFSTVSSELAHATIHDVRLNLFHIWAYSCSNDTPVTVHAVTQGWSQAVIDNFPGPSYGPALVTSDPFNRGYIAEGATSSACPAAWQGIDLGPGGNTLVQGWVDNTTVNSGLTVRSSQTSSYGWKKFASRETPNGPHLTITYSPYDAAYAYTSSTPDVNPPVLNNRAGTVQVKVTNKSMDTWTPSNGYKLTYSVVDDQNNAVYHVPAQTVMPSNVAYGQTVTVNARINPLPPGNYFVRFDMIYVTSSGYALFSEWGVPRSGALALWVPDYAPELSAMYPNNNFEVGSLTPQLYADADTVDAWPSATVNYWFSLCAGDIGAWDWCINSPWQSSPVWKVPANKLTWSGEYYWSVWISDSGGAVTQGPHQLLKTAVRQPVITSRLAQGDIVDEQLSTAAGNFSMSATDATVATVGPPLTVTRTYNSLDPRTKSAFGAGWSTRYDMKVEDDDDATGNVVVTYPDGQQVRFARNANGTFAPPQGRQATFAAISGGGWRLMDRSGTSYRFDGDGRLTSVSDHRGRQQTLTYGGDGKLASATSVGGRTLSFTWTGAHVTSVQTAPVNGNPLTWTYSYSGDRLTQVCAPVAAPNCTTYGAATGSHYRTAVLDSDPMHYWRLGETSGSAANSAVAINLGADDGTFTGATLGVAGALAGASDTAARFTGSESSRINLPKRAVMKAGAYVSLELWFRTSGRGVIATTQNTAPGTPPSTYTPVMYVDTAGKLRAKFWNGNTTTITSAAAVNNNVWHHAVLSATGASQSLYLDGALVGSLSGGLEIEKVPYTLIGTGRSTNWPAGNQAEADPFTGDVDEVAVYDRGLGLPSVREHYNARLAATQLSSVTRPSGRASASVVYDVPNDRVQRLTDRHGGVWQLGTPAVSGSAWGPVTTIGVTDPRGGTTSNTYDPLRGGRVTQQIDQLGKATTYHYDLNGFVAKTIDRNANSTTFWRDTRGNMISRTRCRDANTCYSEYFGYFINPDNVFDPRNDQLTSHADGRSANLLDGAYARRWEYNTAGDQVTETDPPTPAGTATRTRAYTAGTEPAIGGGTVPPGLLATASDARSKTTSYQYRSSGDLAKVTDPAGLVTELETDALGRVTKRTVYSDAAPTGAVTTIGYDGLSRVTGETSPPVVNIVTAATHTARTEHTYDADGNELTETIIDTSGGDTARTTTSTYDTAGRLATVTDAEGNQEKYGYDTTGEVTSYTDPNGNEFVTTYTARGEKATRKLKAWTGDPNSPSAATDVALESWAYDPGGRLASYTDAMSRTTSYTYFGDDLPFRTVGTGVRLNGNTTPRDVVLAEYQYDLAGNPTRETTGGGKTRVDRAYDAAGNRTVEVLDPAGLARRTEATYDLERNVTRTVLTGAGTTRTETTNREYDNANRVIKEIVENGDVDLTTTIAREQRGLVKAVVDPRGNVTGGDVNAHVTSYTHDALGRLIQRADPTVQVERNGGSPTSSRPLTSYGYNTFDDRTHERDPEGRTTVTGHDKASRVTSITAPSYTPPGGTAITPQTGIGYDDAGNVTSRTDARGSRHDYTYDQLGNLARVLEPAVGGQARGVSIFGHDLAGEQLYAVDPTGARTEATYDDLGRQITSTVIERKPTTVALVTAMTYDDSGAPTRITRPGGAAVNTASNAAGETTQVTDPLNHSTQFGHDIAGRQTYTWDANGAITTGTYDLAGRTVAVGDFDPSFNQLRSFAYGYDPAGNQTSATSAEGNVTRRTYDAANRLTALIEPTTGTATITTSFGYDAAGAQTRLTDGRGNATITTYNSLALTESVIEPSTTAYAAAADRTYTSAYDAAGNEVRAASPGGVAIARTFDELNRLTRETGTGGAVTTADNAYGYDLAGRLTSLTGQAGNFTATWDDRGNQLTTTSANGNAAFAYTSRGALAQRTDKAGTATFGYDLADRLTSANDPVTAVTATLGYDVVDRLTGLTYGTGGPTRAIGYDHLNRVTSDAVKNAAGTALSSRTYGYDKDDNLTSKTVAGGPNEGANTYAYDKSSRLTSWTAPGGTVTAYAWDAAGNRTTAGAATFTYDERNRLTSGGGATYAYSPRGTINTFVRGATTTTLTYDAFDRLRTDGSTSYAYDGLGRLSTRTAGGVTSSFSYATFENDPAAVLNASSTATSKFSRLPDGSPFGVAEGSVGGLAITDLVHGDVVGLLGTSSGGSLTGGTAFGPFGEQLGSTGTKPALGYQGEWTDPTTGRVTMHARWYTPETGTFAGRDSWTIDPNPSVAANRYGYGNANPLTTTDPTGHFGGPGGGRNYPSTKTPSSTSVDLSNLKYGLGVARRTPVGRYAEAGYWLGRGVGWAISRIIWGTPYQRPSDWDCQCGGLRRGRDLPYTIVGEGVSTVRGGGNGGGPGPGTPTLPPPPRIDRGKLVKDAAMTPAPRQAPKPGISQAELDAGRLAIESKQRVAMSDQKLKDIAGELFLSTDARQEATLATDASGAGGGAGDKPPTGLQFPDEESDGDAAIPAPRQSPEAIVPGPRLPQDIAVNPIAPQPLRWNRPVGSSPSQNAHLQARIRQLRRDGATDFRVNQQQVDINGRRVGVNRPDLQYTMNGRRHYEEFDIPSSNRGPAHESRILSNDPTGFVLLIRSP